MKAWKGLQSQVTCGSDVVLKKTILRIIREVLPGEVLVAPEGMGRDENLKAVEVLEEVEVEVDHPTRHLHLVVPTRAMERMYVGNVYEGATGSEIAKSFIWPGLTGLNAHEDGEPSAQKKDGNFVPPPCGHSLPSLFTGEEGRCGS